MSNEHIEYLRYGEAGARPANHNGRFCGRLRLWQDGDVIVVQQTRNRNGES